MQSEVALLLKDDTLGAVAHNEVGLYGLCLTDSIGDMCFNGVVACGALLLFGDVICPERNIEITFFIGSGGARYVTRIALMISE